MSPQADYVVSNGTGAAVRSDINGQLAAIVSNNSGASAPATTYAYMLWADTSTNLLKLRNGANSAWITVGDLTAANLGLASLASPTFTGTATIPTLTVSTGANIPLGTAASPTLYFTGDTNTGLYSPGADQLALTTGGTGRLFITSAGLVGIGTSGPSFPLHVVTSGNSGLAVYAGTSGANQVYLGNTAGESVVGTLSNQNFGIVTNGGQKVTVTTGGNVGIGTTSPSSNLHVSAASGTAIKISETNNGVSGSLQAGSTSVSLGTDTNHTLNFYTNAVERARIDTSGRLLVGTSSSSANARIVAQGNSDNASSSAEIYLQRGEATPASGTNLATILFADSGAGVGAQINAARDGGTWSGSSKPGRLVFSTTADGASSPTERMRIKANADICFNTTDASPAESNVEGVTFQGTGSFGTSSHSRSGFAALLVNRKTNDGELIRFYQDGTQEGSISVSGTTVSYNGAHLSRWSQLPSGQEREEILRGTVLSNIDEMCEWDEEDNEQLNRMKVSDVEGDKNVSGVFQAWDDDDDTYTNDFFCAMTGDFIIRIAEGVTVERGDLLMSAGDGTAKPQDDDIIRSKTIAKVTSTNVSCTYDDGSYCVPCVLMAC